VVDDAFTKDGMPFFAISNSNYCSDGTGAQVQRIFSIYSYAKKLRALFIFTSITSIEVQHGDSFSSADELSQFISDLNKKIIKTLSLDSSSTSLHQRRNLKKIHLKSNVANLFLLIPLIKIYASLFHKPFMVMLDDCYKFTDSFPNTLLSINPIDQVIDKNMSREINIQIHIRMSTLSHLSDRYIPMSYYLDWIRFLKALFDSHSVQYTIGIHSDCDLAKINPNLVNENLTSQTFNYWQSIGILTKEGNFNYDLLRIYEQLIASIRSEVGQVEIFSALNPLESWEIMRKAHVLFISRSSFSYVGALLATNSVIVVPVMMAPGPSTWIVSNGISTSAQKKLKRKLQDLVLII
jgi:hypothetical protein